MKISKMRYCLPRLLSICSIYYFKYQCFLYPSLIFVSAGIMFWKRNELKTCLDKLMGKKKSDEGENEEQQQGTEGAGIQRHGALKVL